jgi:hypothetical protein
MTRASTMRAGHGVSIIDATEDTGGCPARGAALLPAGGCEPSR